MLSGRAHFTSRQSLLEESVGVDVVAVEDPGRRGTELADVQRDGNVSLEFEGDILVFAGFDQFDDLAEVVHLFPVDGDEHHRIEVLVADVDLVA